jgi:hypothetical protein
MPFHIERIHFDRRGEYSTQGAFIHAATLTIGKRVTIRSKTDPQRETSISLFQTALIPAAFGDYEILNQSEGRCSVVLWRWKEG